MRHVERAPGPGCELPADGWLTEPVAAVTSLAFVVAAVVVLARAHGRRRPWTYVLLVAGVGVGSVVQHGPDPAWSDVAHDLPLLATLAFVAADAVAGLRGRRGAPTWWWLAPTAAVLPVVVLAPRAGDAAQAVLAAVAVLLTVLRARATPEVRRRTAVALLALGVGALVGTLSRAGGPWCDPESLWQGHAVWHVLAAVALAVLAPALTSVTTTTPAARPGL